MLSTSHACLLSSERRRLRCPRTRCTAWLRLRRRRLPSGYAFARRGGVVLSRVDGATFPQRLYSIKRRDERVPLSISVADAQVRMVVCARACLAALKRSRRPWWCCKDVELYGRAAHFPPGLLEELLPGERARHVCVAVRVLTVVAPAGPVTVVLERVPGALSSELNPGVERIGATHGACWSPNSMLSRVLRRHPRAGQRFHTLNRSRIRRSAGAHECQRERRIEHACCERVCRVVG